MKIRISHIVPSMPGRWFFLWGSALGVTLVFHIVFTLHSGIAEQLYGQGIWPFWRTFFSSVFVPLELNILYGFTVVLLVFTGWVIWSVFAKKRGVSFLLRQLFLVLAAVYICFQWMWGFNYQRPTLEGRLEWESDRSIAVDSVKRDLEYWTNLLTEERKAMQANRDFFAYEYKHSYLAKDLDRIIRQEVLPVLGYDTPAVLGVRELYPRGVLLRIGTAGFYLPFSGEGQIDRGLHPLQKPFTTAHEMGHAAGISGEGDCNFIGVLACLQSEDPFIRYSGRLAMWRYLAAEVKRTDPPWYDHFYDRLDPVIIEDLQSIRNRMQKFPDLFPALRDRMYDTYLRAQGVEGGMANYSIVVRLMHRGLKEHPGLVRGK